MSYTEQLSSVIAYLSSVIAFSIPFFIAIGTVFIMILWLIIGWRAMKAHERLADSSDEIRHAVRAYVKDRLNHRANRDSTGLTAKAPPSPR